MTKTVSLYGGKHKVTYTDSGRKHSYFIHSKNKVAPGVTSIIKAGIPKDTIPKWASNTCGDYINQGLKAGRTDWDALCAEGKVEFEKVGDRAKNRGKMVHAWIERWLESGIGTGSIELPMDQQVINACTAFITWYQQHSVQVIERERIVYSDALHYAGTLDLYAKVDGELCILDIKTSKSSALYREMPIQCAGYAVALDEELSINHCHGWIILLDKETGACTPNYVPLNPLKGAWKNCLSWYRALQVLDQTCDEIKLATSEGRRSWSEQPTFTQALAASLERQT